MDTHPALDGHGGHILEHDILYLTGQRAKEGVSERCAPPLGQEEEENEDPQGEGQPEEGGRV